MHDPAALTQVGRVRILGPVTRRTTNFEIFVDGIGPKCCRMSGMTSGRARLPDTTGTET